MSFFRFGRSWFVLVFHKHPRHVPEGSTLPGRRAVLAYAFRCCSHWTRNNMSSTCTLRERRVVLVYAMV
jgi:hypothetical protein